MTSERSETLVAYDENLNPIGEYPRSEIHAREMRHKTVRVWCVVDDKYIVFQRRSAEKKLFPGMLDPIATGHVDPGEGEISAALRELREETSLVLNTENLIPAGDLDFKFTRPDGKLDNEHAYIYVYRADRMPNLEKSEEVCAYIAVSLENYAKLMSIRKDMLNNLIYGYEKIAAIIRENSRIDAEAYVFDAHGALKHAGKKIIGVDDFCAMSEPEWDLIVKALNPAVRPVI